MMGKEELIDRRQFKKISIVALINYQAAGMLRRAFPVKVRISGSFWHVLRINFPYRVGRFRFINQLGPNRDAFKFPAYRTFDGIAIAVLGLWDVIYFMYIPGIFDIEEPPPSWSFPFNFDC